MRQSACLEVNNFASLFNCTPVGRASDSMMAPNIKLFILVGWGRSIFFLSVSWPTGVQLLVFFYSSVSMGCLTPQGSPGVGRNTLFLSSPHLCFNIVCIRDLFIFRDDPLLS